MPKKKNKPTTPEQDQIDIFAAVAHGMEGKTPEERADRVERIGFYSLQDQHVVDACSDKPVEPWTETAEKSFREALEKIRVFFLSDEYEPIKKMLPGTSEWFEVKATGITAREITALGDFIDQLTAFMPLIQEELKAYKKEHGLKDVTFSDFINDTEGESIFSIVFNRAREKAVKKNNLPSLNVKHTDKYYIAIASIMGKLTEKNTLNTPQKALVIKNPKGRGKAADEPANVFLMVNSNVPLEGNRPLDPYSKYILDTTFTHYKTGNRGLTADILYRTTHPRQPSAQRKEKIDEIMENAMQTFIELDLSDEAKARDYKYYDKDGKEIKVRETSRKGALINAVKHDFICNGVPLTGYVLSDNNQALFDYLISINGFLEVPLEIMKAPLYKLDRNDNITDKPISLSVSMELARHHLAKRIAIMLRDKTGKQKPLIRFANLYRECGLDPYKMDRKQKQRLRDFIRACLYDWKERGFIKDHSFTGIGTADPKITIELPPGEPRKAIPEKPVKK